MRRERDALGILIVLQRTTLSAIAAYVRDLTAFDIAAWSIGHSAVFVLVGIFVGLLSEVLATDLHMIISGIACYVSSIVLAQNQFAPPAVVIGIYALGGRVGLSGAAPPTLVILATPVDQRVDAESTP